MGMANAREPGCSLSKPKLAVTVAFDPPETGGTLQMAKMLAGSLVRNYFGGEVKVFRNSAGPLFLVFREGLEEVVVDTPALKGAQLADHARRWVPKVREMFNAEDYEWVLWLDADCLVLRDLDHLFRTDADVLVVRDAAASPGDERYAGFLTVEELEKEAQRPSGRMPNVSVYPAATWAWAVRGEHFAALMAEWERVMGLSPSRPTSRVDASAWNRVLRDCGLRVKPFEDGEMRCPLTHDPDWKTYRDAAVLHCTGASQADRIQFMFGAYMARFYGDPGITFLNLIEM